MLNYQRVIQIVSCIWIYVQKINLNNLSTFTYNIKFWNAHIALLYLCTKVKSWGLSLKYVQNLYIFAYVYRTSGVLPRWLECANVLTKRRILRYPRYGQGLDEAQNWNHETQCRPAWGMGLEWLNTTKLVILTVFSIFGVPQRPVPGGLYECHLQKASEEFENCATVSERDQASQLGKPLGMEKLGPGWVSKRLKCWRSWIIIDHGWQWMIMVAFSDSDRCIHQWIHQAWNCLTKCYAATMV